MFYFSPTYLIYMIPAFILMALTSWYVKSAYRKWGRVAVSSRLTGAQAAQRLMSTGNLYGLQIQGVAGELTDHYDPRNKTLYLSQGVGNGNSVASVAIAAHELGHAMQDAEEYFPLRFRSALVPIVTEAGGRFTGLDGRSGCWSGNAVATNGLLHETVLDLIGD